MGLCLYVVAVCRLWLSRLASGDSGDSGGSGDGEDQCSLSLAVDVEEASGEHYRNAIYACQTMELAVWIDCMLRAMHDHEA